MAGVLEGAADVSHARQGRGSGHVKAKVLRAGHVPVPVWCGAARWASRGLHGHGHHVALQEDEWLQCHAPDGMGCLRAARGAVRDSDRHAPRCDNEEEHRSIPRAAASHWLQLRLETGGLNHRRQVLQMDAVDFLAASRKGAGIPGRGARELVPRAGNGPCQRGSH